MEIESENSLPFLDVKVTRDRNQVHTSVYRKPTHTDRYLNYGSNHHPRIKSGIIKCLAHRARSVCSKDTIRTELDHLQEVFESNAYPPSLVTLNLHTKRNKRSNIVENTEKQPATLATPYVKGLSEKIEKKCKHLNIRTVFSSKRTLRRELVRVKNRVEPTDMKGVVYKIDCSCGQSYIGETGRTLSTRVKEHKKAVEKDDINNGISVHANSTWHNIDWDSAQVIEVEKNLTKRKLKESMHINSTISTSNMNLDKGLQVNQSWITCFQSHP